MSFILILLLIVAGIYILGKAYEYYRVSKIVNVKNGKYLPHTSFFSQLNALNPYRKEPHEVIMERFKEHGPIFGRFFIKIFDVIIGDPTLAKQALLNSKAIHKIGLQNSIHASRFVGDENVLFSNGESWRNQRSIVNPAFVSTLQKF